MLTQLRSYWPGTSNRYIEPFAGSACLFFDLEPRQAVLGDLNSELIQSYEALKHDASLVLECFRRLRRGKQSYYRIRRIDPQSLTPSELAARFLYLNRYCFNGLYRTNMAGTFNVPYGPPKQPLVNFEANVLRASSLLRCASLVNTDFEDTIKGVRRGDFVFLDPPYFVASTRTFTEYLAQPFTSHDLNRLRSCLKYIDDVGAIFLVSYADSQEARDLLRPWPFTQIHTRRNIAGFAGARRGAFELVASNLPLDRRDAV